MLPRFIMGLLGCVSIISLANAQLCTPTLTPEQAFLSLKSPTQTATISTTLTPTLININTATEAELTQLDGIGAKKAQDIILYREMIHPFNNIDELDNVKGIGKATVDKNRHRLTVR